MRNRESWKTRSNPRWRRRTLGQCDRRLLASSNRFQDDTQGQIAAADLVIDLAVGTEFCCASYNRERHSVSDKLGRQNRPALLNEDDSTISGNGWVFCCCCCCCRCCCRCCCPGRFREAIDSLMEHILGSEVCCGWKWAAFFGERHRRLCLSLSLSRNESSRACLRPKGSNNSVLGRPKYLVRGWWKTASSFVVWRPEISFREPSRFAVFARVEFKRSKQKTNRWRRWWRTWSQSVRPRPSDRDWDAGSAGGRPWCTLGPTGSACRRGGSGARCPWPRPPSPDRWRSSRRPAAPVGAPAAPPAPGAGPPAAAPSPASTPASRPVHRNSPQFNSVKLGTTRYNSVQLGKNRYNSVKLGKNR